MAALRSSPHSDGMKSQPIIHSPGCGTWASQGEESPEASPCTPRPGAFPSTEALQWPRDSASLSPRLELEWIKTSWRVAQVNEWER